MLLLNNILSVILCVSCNTLYAQSPAEKTSQWQFTVGAGLFGDSQAWKGIDTEVAIIPFVEANIGNWFFNVDTPVAYKAEINSWSSVYVGLSPRSDAYERTDFVVSNESESTVFNNYKIPHTETVIKYGGSLGWLSIDASTDISENSESNTASLTIEVPVYQGKTGLEVSTSVSAHWMDANYVNHYYGISGEQIDRSLGRVSYQTQEAINYELTINAMYPLSSHWILASELSYTSLADEISDSPLIDSDHQDTFALLAIYQF